MMKGSKMDGIEVAVRLRSLNQSDRKKGSSDLFRKMTGWRVIPNKNAVIQLSDKGAPLPAKNGRTSFSFNRAFDGNASNEDIYGLCEKTLASFLSGINGSIISYGHTGSGKTFTIFGNQSKQGLIHLAGKDIINNINRNPNLEFALKMSAFELYNQEVRDLKTNAPINPRQDPKSKLLMDVSEVEISDLKSFNNFVQTCHQNASVRKTEMNANSSRSHVIFRMTLTGIVADRSSEHKGADFKSTLHIVDLAGSNTSLRSTKKIDGNQQKEANNINKGLLALSNVINGLSKKTFVNFRNATLTRILQPFLDGSTKTMMICCASPAGAYTENTRKTLEVGQSARQISTSPKINVTSKRSKSKQSSKMTYSIVEQDKKVLKNSRLTRRQSVRSVKEDKKPQNLPSIEKNWQQLQDEYVSMPDMNVSISELEDQKMLAIERQWQSLQNNYDSANHFKAKLPEVHKTIQEKEKNFQSSMIPSKNTDIPALIQDEDVYSVSSDSEVSDLCSDSDDKGLDVPDLSQEKPLDEKHNTNVDEETCQANVIEDQVFKVGENRAQDAVTNTSNDDDFNEEDEEAEFYIEEQDDFSSDSFMTEDIRFRPMSAIHEEDKTIDSIEGSKDSTKFVESESKSMDSPRLNVITTKHNDTKPKQSTDGGFDRSSTTESKEDVHIGTMKSQRNTFKDEISEEMKSETQNIAIAETITPTNQNIGFEEKLNHFNSDASDSSRLHSGVIEDMDQKSLSTKDSYCSEDAADTSTTNSTAILNEKSESILVDPNVPLLKEQNTKNSEHMITTSADIGVKSNSNEKDEASSPSENEKPSDDSIVVSSDHINDVSIPVIKGVSDSERSITGDVTSSTNIVAEAKVDSSINERKEDCVVSVSSVDKMITKTVFSQNNEEINEKDDSLSREDEAPLEENEQDFNDSTDPITFPKNVTQEYHKNFVEEDSINGEIHQENIDHMKDEPCNETDDEPCNETEDEQRGMKTVVETMLSYSEESDGPPKGDNVASLSSSNEDRITAEEMVGTSTPSEEKDLPPDETMASTVNDEASQKSSDQSEPKHIISGLEKIDGECVEETSPNDEALESAADTISDIESISFATSHLENEVMKLKEENIVLMKMITMVRENNHRDFYEPDNGLSDISHDSGLFIESIESTERSINEDRDDHGHFNGSTESNRSLLSGRKAPQLLLKTEECESSICDDDEENDLIQDTGSNQKQAYTANAPGDVICNTSPGEIVHSNSEDIAQTSISAQSHLVGGDKLNLKRNLQKSMINFEAKMQRTMKQEEIILQRWEDLSGDFRNYRLRWASKLNRRCGTA